MRKFIWVFAVVWVPLWGWAQSNASLQRFTVTSVTLVMDSVKTAADAELVKQAITVHKEVKDFDIKMKKCNFTMDNSNNKLDQILRELEAYNQPARIYAVRANESFTHVPEESCDTRKKSVPDMSEDEVKKRGITRTGGQ